MTDTGLGDKTVAELIAMFEEEARHECRETLVVLRNSVVVEEIINRGRGILGSIAEYLERTRPVNGVRMSWGYVLSWVGIELDLFPIPLTYDDLNAWIAWANQHAVNAPKLPSATWGD